MKKITLIKCYSLLILSLVLINNLNAQKENNNWYFGDKGLNFNDGTLPPTIILNSAMSTDGSSASVSDSSGNLLFYTNGVNIWNTNNQTMPNGTGIKGTPDINQSVVIIPDPSNSDRFYVITNGPITQIERGIFYTVVDMSLEGGLGDVDILQKNMVLFENISGVVENVSTNMTSVLNPNDNTYWLVIFGFGDEQGPLDTLFSYKVDATGISLVNQTTFTFNLTLSVENSNGGQMKISPDGQTLALIHNTVGAGRGGEFEEAQSIFTFDFDSLTGVVSLLNDSIFLDNSLYCYGVEFSPDSNFLYVSSTNELIDGTGLNGGTPVGRIYQIEHKISNSSLLIYNGLDPIYGLQSAIDGKIYAVNSSGNLGVINTPNISGAAGANYIHGDILLGTSTAYKELPQLVPDILLNVETKKAKQPLIMGNPFKEEIKIKFKVIQDYTIELFSSSGALVKSLIYDNMRNRKPYEVDTSDLPVDTYYLIIRDEQSQIWYDTMLKVE
jgi:hypothetical protein